MSQSSEVRIGERIRFYRQAKGKTQAVIAGLAGVSEDYLSQIERGLKTPTIALLHRFAKILGVRISDLLGESAAAQEETTAPAGKAVQHALMAYGQDQGAAGPPDLADLRGRVDAAWMVWQQRPNRFSEESAVLPALISDVQAAQQRLESAGDQQRRESQQVAADLYFLLRSFTKRIGRPDLSLLVADRGVLAAQAAEDPVRVAAAKWNLGHILLAQGDGEAAEEVAISAVEELERQDTVGDLDAVAMAGALWLVSAVAAVRSGDPWTARERLRDKALPAARAAGEGNVMWTVFGPVNVALHAMSLEMEMGEAAEALRLGDSIDASALPSRERRTTFALEVARCYEQRRDDPGVFLHLIEAEASGPEDMRYNQLARELVQGLLKRARPTYASQVRALAGRIGLLA
jgi:transcriptional regulator with XRE-family HTH domain